MVEAGANARLKEEEPPGGTDSGKVNPEEANPVPEREACVTLSVAVPGFLIVSVWELVTPTVTLPKLTLEGMTEICDCTPVPLRVIVEGEFVALLTTVTLPERLPVEAGVNVTPKDLDCPTARVRGSVIPLVLKPVPVALICETETLELPVFEIVTFCVALEPVARLPKFSDVGDTESCSVEAAPVPLRGITSDEVGALLISVMLPEKVPAVAGAKPTLNETAPPGAIERGTVSPVEVNPVPTREACVRLRVAVPELRIVSVWLPLAPTIRLPNDTLEGVTLIWGCTPVPLRDIVRGELVALLTTLMLPTAAPAIVGEKFAASGRL